MFDFKQQAQTLGNYIHAYAAMAKQLNAHMVRCDVPTQDIMHIIGSGRFNRAITEAPEGEYGEGTVLYGAELIAQRHGKKHTGLLGALAEFHHPLLGFAQQLLIDLGKKGYSCVVEHAGGRISIPLHQLKIDFDEKSRIFTTSDITVNGKTLPKGFVLADSARADMAFYHGGKGLHCSICDSAGQKLDPGEVPPLLWIGVAGRGKNVYGEKGPKNNVLMAAGIDDMDEANDHLVEAVATLQRNHGYDPQPLWDQVMASAKERLKPYAETLAVARQVIASSRKEADFTRPLFNVGYTHRVQTIDYIAEFFDLGLPALSQEQQAYAERIGARINGGVTLNR